MMIRPAVHQDIETWAQLRNQLWPDNVKCHLNELRAYYDNTSNDIVQVFVAEVSVANKPQVVGFIELNLRNFAEGSQARLVPYVEGWFVAPEFRHLGIGQQLMHQAHVWAKDAGFRELASDTEITNTKSIKLHKKLGFKEIDRVVCFLKSLE